MLPFVEYEPGGHQPDVTLQLAMKFLLLSFCLLVQWSALAQSTIISGRVVDIGNGQPLPGATILQFNTVNGVSSDTDGSFSLTVSGRPDSVTISVSSIGYTKQQRRVAAASSSVIALVPSQEVFCELPVYFRFEAGPLSGLRYTPLGATLQVFGQRFINKPINIIGSYQTNLRRNYATTVGVSLPPVWIHRRISTSEIVEYQRLQAQPANLRFSSFRATVGLGVYRIGGVLVPSLLVGAGYATYQPLHLDQAATAGYGYSIGLRRYFNYPFYTLVHVQATHWPDFWQLQGSASCSVFGKFSAGISFNQLRSYQEISLTLTRTFY
ncbi:carboxypeptidase-like regulatory domain-containing protein [Hymenobacter cellulosilyticus]|uniref:Carboxypeptidase-like regulatory domain-containing protein n=1 Tax=Hymenobacter cellulosilyticus TaxID=2932248 RepID=A0A8T9QI66_9BACT|nr:carboxypeptidase-like regulatory domain-containing protein [Hymenobacter cellulosilyticus]UOQ74483.1 carboxypeptidase-like regulatory domain-containing protein [Hymenobacter cellulosilyticus]